MKKIIILMVIIIGFFAWQTVFAQTEAIDLEKVDYRYNAVLEFFLQLTKEQDYEKAYGYMAGNFPKKYSLENFKQMVQAVGLTTFTERKWTFFKDQMKEIGVTTVKGKFLTPDQVTHELTFYMIIGGETEIKIGDIIETLTFEDLAKLAPPQNILNEMILKDLKKVAFFIKKNRAKSAYKYLSQAAKARMKYSKVKKIFLILKSKKWDVSLPKTGLITITPGYPAINSQGLLEIQGTYQNTTSVVNFALAYDYEWQWNLGVFSFSVTKLNAKK
ncbi:hypothetical protein HZC21_05835 [Candidatus Peregrinibacteria bacterium]|nr:hypothetical protein [Candidatus Peregrinibacteria bacterium]